MATTTASRSFVARVSGLRRRDPKPRSRPIVTEPTSTITRVPILGFLRVQNTYSALKAPFKPPAGCSSGNSRRKTLGVRRRPGVLPGASGFRRRRPVKVQKDETPYEPLMVWGPAEGEPGTPVFVDPILCRFLRPHQRLGVQFLFECVCGLREFDGKGCILADDMGLGKTLQSITLLWTVLNGRAHPERPAKRVIVVTPTSLVANWKKELEKWLTNKVRAVALSEASREEATKAIKQFTTGVAHQVLILSYDTFRIHAEKFTRASCCDLLICDEAHRLKNDKTLTSQALSALPCASRVLLSGTPMQNDLEEFFAMVDFANPGVLGTAAAFRKRFQAPILIGREPDATYEERQLAEQRSGELSTIVNSFILRRTNTILSKHLPPKLVQVVCCSLSPLQRDLYRHFLASKSCKALLKGKDSRVLSFITSLKKLCNHPALIRDAARAAARGGGRGGKSAPMGFEGCERIFEQYEPQSEQQAGTTARGRRRARGHRPSGVISSWSGKFEVLARMLTILRLSTQDRIVLVSNYGQTLDIIVALCRERDFPFVRLDGSTSAAKRQRLVDKFNDFSQDVFCFLLSSKAGGCGLNLVGGNRLVLFDPDWNPATDKQAAARVWRDGQRKKTYIYRFLCTGTIEEKIFQRQLSKEGLQSIVASEKDHNSLSSAHLRDLFTLREGNPSDTHTSLRCDRCPGASSSSSKENACANSEGAEEAGADKQPATAWPVGTFQKQLWCAAEADLNSWSHHFGPTTTNDTVLRQAGADGLVSFVFGMEVAGNTAVMDKPPTAADSASAAATITQRPPTATPTPTPTPTTPAAAATKAATPAEEAAEDEDAAAKATAAAPPPPTAAAHRRRRCSVSRKPAARGRAVKAKTVAAPPLEPSSSAEPAPPPTAAAAAACGASARRRKQRTAKAKVQAQEVAADDLPPAQPPPQQEGKKRRASPRRVKRAPSHSPVAPAAAAAVAAVASDDGDIKCSLPATSTAEAGAATPHSAVTRDPRQRRRLAQRQRRMLVPVEEGSGDENSRANPPPANAASTVATALPRCKSDGGMPTAAAALPPRTPSGSRHRLKGPLCLATPTTSASTPTSTTVVVATGVPPSISPPALLQGAGGSACAPTAPAPAHPQIKQQGRSGPAAAPVSLASLSALPPAVPPIPRRRVLPISSPAKQEEATAAASVPSSQDSVSSWSSGSFPAPQLRIAKKRSRLQLGRRSSSVESSSSDTKRARQLYH